MSSQVATNLPVFLMSTIFLHGQYNFKTVLNLAAISSVSGKVSRIRRNN